MKTDTESYVKLQKMYKEQARIENAQFKALLKKTHPELSLDEAVVDAFVKNAHHLRLLRGREFGVWEKDQAALGAFRVLYTPFCFTNATWSCVANALQTFPRETATHLALSAHANLLARDTGTSLSPSFLPTLTHVHSAPDPSSITAESLTTEIQTIVGQGVALPDELADAVGEVYVSHLRPLLYADLTPFSQYP